MGIRTKFNLVLLAVAVLALVLFAFVATPIFQAEKKEEILGQARLLMESAQAIRNYTSEEITPVLDRLQDEKFYPQSVAAYAAVHYFEALHKKHPEFTYREPALNPTNPAHRASDWEADIINDFRNNPTKTELVTERETHDGRVLNLSHPLVATQVCLRCHDTPDAAPKSMVAAYGRQNGFGWKLNEVVGAQIVTVPLSVPLARAQQVRWLIAGALAGVFLLVILLIDALLGLLVIFPVRRMSRIASEVSLGKMDSDEYVKSGSDEVSSLSVSLNRMRRSMNEVLRLMPPGDQR
jgi:HAMP domain-containing protein